MANTIATPHFGVVYLLAASGGSVTDNQLSQQIAVLNQNFAASGLTFTLAGTKRIISADWFNNAGPGNPQEKAMKSALRTGGAATLNIYTVGFLSGPGVDLLGYATFPWDYAAASTNDGIVIRYSALPGGSIIGYNTGRILTHEVGRK